MNSIIRRLFGSPTPDVLASTLLPASHSDNPATIEDNSDNAMRRQLVQLLMRNVLRRHAIPPQWLECQMLVVSSRSRGTGLYARLTIKHWDERLMNHAQAFQRALQTDIAHFDPKASNWLHGISWALDMGDSCPYTSLPDKAFWLAPAKKHGPGAQAIETSDAHKDLESLFLARDRELGQPIGGHAPPGYEKTQPISL